MTRRSPARRHPAIAMHREEHRAGLLGRREFLCRATALGLSATSAWQLIGGAPARAQTTPGAGGTLRIQMPVLAQKDPRTYDFAQQFNAMSGLLETLVAVQRDGSLTGVLLERWEAADDAAGYTLYLRKGVLWNDGTPFTAEDVAANFRGWCDRTVAGNSMAARLDALIDPASGTIAENALEIVDDTTLRLNLRKPDITLIPNLSDYPAVVVPAAHVGQNPLEHGIGTGAYRLDSYEEGQRVVLTRATDHAYWGQAFLDRVEFVDLGPNPANIIAAAQAGEIDMIYDSAGGFVEIYDAIGWQKSAIETTSTIVIRTHQTAVVDGITPYADARVRRALALAVDNSVILELGYSGLGQVAANHHVGPLHPEYADIGLPQTDIARARKLMEEAGMPGFEHELISIDDDWQRDTADVMAAQLRDAGFRVRRTLMPSETYWTGWATYPFSTTAWVGRELGVQVLALAYRTGEAWNETGFSHAGFDALLDEAMGLLDVEKRQKIMARLEQILIDEGVIVQPYWRTLFRHVRPGVLGGDRHQKDMINVHELGLSDG